EEVCSALRLRGSNGIDFVVDRAGEVWLMEVNPRLQGSLELLESASRRSVLNMHVNACGGILPRAPLAVRPGVKMIVYATRSGTVSDLRRIPGAIDITPSGSVIRRGDPVCTLITIGDELAEAYARAIERAQYAQPTVSPQYVP
ncbi:MAG: ATP-grasp domain-containing protein, partial [Candidatus Thorarchaeota archaeon]|nr:ATP-grasp domain-containing protein [Candidatus Thorarchaeota archaeon]